MMTGFSHHDRICTGHDDDSRAPRRTIGASQLHYCRKTEAGGCVNSHIGYYMRVTAAPFTHAILGHSLKAKPAGRSRIQGQSWDIFQFVNAESARPHYAFLLHALLAVGCENTVKLKDIYSKLEIKIMETAPEPGLFWFQLC